MITLTEQEKRILGTVDPIAVRLGLEVVRLRVTGGRRPGIQIMVDKAGGALATIDDCARLSRKLGPEFEEHDPLPEAYTLEVSTPGIDRPLTRPGDFARWIGHAVKVELARPLEGRRRLKRIITGEGDDGAIVQLDDHSELVVEIHEMTKASLILTDELIDAARATAGLPPQPDLDDLSGFEIDDTNTEEESGDVS